MVTGGLKVKYKGNMMESVNSLKDVNYQNLLGLNVLTIAFNIR